MVTDSYALGWKAGSIAGRKYGYQEGLRRCGRMGKVAYRNGYKAGYRKGFKVGRQSGYRMGSQDEASIRTSFFPRSRYR